MSSEAETIMRNSTAVTDFILLELTDDPRWQFVVFNFLLVTYMLSVTGNLIIIILTHSDAHLMTPMYFFLCNFSLLEISFTSVYIPRFLVTIVTRDRTISYSGCVAQLFFSFSWEWLDFTFWLPCPMIIMWPCANLSNIQQSWATLYAFFLSFAHGLQDAWLIFHQLSFCYS